MKLREARNGREIHIKHRPVPFSFFPTYHRERREGVNSTLFVTNPWNIICESIENIPNDIVRKRSLAFFNQARDFFTAAQNADINAAKPLLLYYSFLNLAKCFIIQKRKHPFNDSPRHGLKEKLFFATGALRGHICIQTHSDDNVFSNFAEELGAGLQRQQQGVNISPRDFLSQILVGHRVFCQDRTSKEKFINLDQIDYMHDVNTKEAWLRVRAYKDDFTRLYYNHTDLSEGLNSGQTCWQNVKCDEEKYGRPMIEAETVHPVVYENRPSEILESLSQNIRPRLWRTATSYPPYREYYIYLPAPKQILLDQIVIIYLATFGFGSLTRYKPEQFEDILKSSIGPFVLEFFASQPSQFLYLMASEFMKQEVAKAAVV